MPTVTKPKLPNLYGLFYVSIAIEFARRIWKTARCSEQLTMDSEVVIIFISGAITNELRFFVLAAGYGLSNKFDRVRDDINGDNDILYGTMTIRRLLKLLNDLPAHTLHTAQDATDLEWSPSRYPFRLGMVLDYLPETIRRADFILGPSLSSDMIRERVVKMVYGKRNAGSTQVSTF
jgi:hypothetical protein